MKDFGMQNPIFRIMSTTSTNQTEKQRTNQDVDINQQPQIGMMGNTQMNNPKYHMEGIQSQNEKNIGADNNQNNLMMEQIGNNKFDELSRT